MLCTLLRPEALDLLQQDRLTMPTGDARLVLPLMTHRDVPKIPRLFRVVGVCCVALLLCLTAMGQDPFNSMSSPITGAPGYYSNGGTPVIVKVLTAKDIRLDRQAIVKLSNESTHYETTQTTDGNSESAFVGLQFGHYVLEVSAVGYLTVRKEFQLV